MEEAPGGGRAGVKSVSRAQSPQLPRVLAPLEADLACVEERYLAIVTSVSDRTRDLLDEMPRFAGKRLRPSLACVAGRVACGEVTEEVATVAAIVELIHTATLIHDDLIDAAEVRRKRATLNARFGDQFAVLVGDVLFTKAYMTAAQLEDRFASRYLSAVVDEILEGEIHQDLVTRDASLEASGYREIIRGKTAALYEAALVVGAHYGGRPDLGRPLGRYGHHLGMAFQIVDDRLDLTGDEAQVGKTLGRDLGEGKTTLPVILWRESRPETERAEALALVEAAWDDPEAAARLCARLDADGALAATDAAAEVEVEAAVAALADLPASKERDLLETIARFVLDRSW